MVKFLDKIFKNKVTTDKPKFYEPDLDYLEKHLVEEMHCLTQVAKALNEDYHKKESDDPVVKIAGKKVYAEDAFQTAQDAREEGYHHVSNVILDSLSKINYPEAFLKMSEAYANGWGVKVDLARVEELNKMAFSIWESRVAAGDADAMYELGVCYRRGEGVTQNDEKAVSLYQKAFEKGHVMAANNLAIMYINGLGVKKDLAKANKYLEYAAGRGSLHSITMLGNAYYYGRGVTQDYQKAIELFNKSAEQEEGDALYHLALCYQNGTGVEKDNEKAIQYLYRSADAGWQTAINSLEENGLPYPQDDGRP